MPNRSEPTHYAYPVPIEHGENVGGRAVFEGTDVSIRCGCTESLENYYGHEKEQEAMMTNSQGFPLTRVECVTCGWFNESGDYGSTKHSAVVHSTMLRPGHVTRMTIQNGVAA